MHSLGGTLLSDLSNSEAETGFGSVILKANAVALNTIAFHFKVRSLVKA